MQLRADQLQQHLSQPLAGLYVLHGDELRCGAERAGTEQQRQRDGGQGEGELGGHGAAFGVVGGAAHALTRRSGLGARGR